MNYPQGSGSDTTFFAYDSAGRRSDIWMQSNAVQTMWAARENTTYDNPGRITAVLGQEGPATSTTTVVSQTTCYKTGSAAPTCAAGSTTDQANRFPTDGRPNPVRRPTEIPVGCCPKIGERIS